MVRTGIDVETLDFVYKFTAAKWARHMVDYGRIRVGTLYDYWRPCYPEGVRDEKEGKIMRYTIHDYRPGDPTPPQWNTRFFHIPNGCTATLQNCSGESHLNGTIPNMYVYCVAGHFDRSYFTAFGAQYDTCVRIGPMRQFIEALTFVFRKEMKCRDTLAGLCEYGAREITYNRGVVNCHPAMLKEQSYEDQREFRILGETQLFGIQPKVITIPRHDALFSIYDTV